MSAKPASCREGLSAMRQLLLWRKPLLSFQYFRWMRDLTHHDERWVMIDKRISETSFGMSETTA
jgi:hypothetical protein